MAAFVATGSGGDSIRREPEAAPPPTTAPPLTIEPDRSAVRPCRTDLPPPEVRPATSRRRPSTSIRFGTRGGPGGVPEFDPFVRAPLARLIPIKLPVAVAASTAVTITVPRSERRFTSLLYDVADIGTDRPLGAELGDGDLRTTFRGCRGRETWFGGYFLVTEARCVELAVHARGRVERMRVPFGVPDCASGR